ncbi:hypothetical protein Pmar_PMAR008582, partial [Perkinsus marinus ATCC 50983]
MGLIIARQEAERLDIETSHNKAMEFIQIHHPDYLGNGEVLGLDVGSTSRRDDRTRHASLDTITRGSILTDSDQDPGEGEEANDMFINACRKGRYWLVE